MNGLKILPGFQRAAPGLEWWLWKRLPAAGALGTVLPILLALALRWAAPDEPSAAEERALCLLIYPLIGLVLMHWTLTASLALGCLIVIVMKGPA